MTKAQFIIEAAFKAMTMQEAEWKAWVKQAGLEAGFTAEDLEEAFPSKS